MSKTHKVPEYLTPPEGDYGLEVSCPHCERKFKPQDSGECVHCGAAYQTVVVFDE